MKGLPTLPDHAGDLPSGFDFGSFVQASADVNTVATSDGVYRYVSGASLRVFGWHPGDLEGHHAEEFVHSDDIPALHVGMNESAAGKISTLTGRFRCRDGSYRWTESTTRRVNTQGRDLLVTTIRDIEERRRSEAALERRASTDPLTGVANRTVLMDRLRHGLSRLSRGSEALAVLYLDLDRFKIINDSLGHRIGDAVLAQLAERLTHHLRPADTLARLGGDEFVILAEGVGHESDAIELGNRIVEAGRKPFKVGEEEFVCTLSVGIAWTVDAQHGAEDLLQEADLALYRAKEQGRDRVDVFDEELRNQAVGRLGTERMVRRAIDEHRITVEYQPVLDLHTRRLSGAEALVRILDVNQGLLQPSTFLEVAEESGLLLTIDEQVMADAVERIREWQDRYSGAELGEVSINVTARHLAAADFSDVVIEQLDAQGVPHASLQIEVTERVLMEASNSTMTELRSLRQAGVKVGLDDFGTGYSSLGYLRQFPLDFVKIDRAFIQDLDRDGKSKDTAIVAATIGLCHALDLTVISEGVETEGQLRALESLGCDRIQGFLLAAPAAPEASDRLASSHAGVAFRPVAV